MLIEKLKRSGGYSVFGVLIGGEAGGVSVRMSAMMCRCLRMTKRMFFVLVCVANNAKESFWWFVAPNNQYLFLLFAIFQ